MIVFGFWKQINKLKKLAALNVADGKNISQRLSL